MRVLFFFPFDCFCSNCFLLSIFPRFLFYFEDMYMVMCAFFALIDRGREGRKEEEKENGRRGVDEVRDEDEVK